MDHYILYQGLENLPRQGFMKIGIPEAREIEAKIIPALHGNPPVYVRWHRHRFGQNTLHLLAYTPKELEQREVEDLLAKALDFIRER